MTNTTTPNKFLYYMTQRPTMPGAMPKADLTDICELDPTATIPEINRGAYAVLTYSRPLTYQEIHDYELTPADPHERQCAKGANGEILDFSIEFPNYTTDCRLTSIYPDGEVKPCPFCGEKHDIWTLKYKIAGIDADRYAVMCFGCMALVDVGYAQDRGQALRHWNKRWNRRNNEAKPEK